MKDPQSTPYQKLPQQFDQIQFFDLPHLLKSIRSIQSGRNRGDDPGVLLYRALGEWDIDIRNQIEETELDCYYESTRIPVILDVLLDREFHIDIYNQLLEFFPDDPLLLKYKAACIVSIPTS